VILALFLAQTLAAGEPAAPAGPEAPAEAAVPAEAAPGAPAEPASDDAGAKAEGPRSVRITSGRTDYDRKEGVIMFDRDVFVDDAEYKLHSDQLYVFLDGTNELKRIVAIGNVCITNDTRVGTCAKAAYTKATSRIVMYGDDRAEARLAEIGKRKSEVKGRIIRFFLDSEQVEVEGSTVTLDAGAMGGKEGAKKLLKK